MGRLIGWGRGATEAAARLSNITLVELQPAGITIAMARHARDFYQNAIILGRGALTAPERVRLMERIIELLGGTP